MTEPANVVERLRKHITQDGSLRDDRTFIAVRVGEIRALLEVAEAVAPVLDAYTDMEGAVAVSGTRRMIAQTNSIMALRATVKALG